MATETKRKPKMADQVSVKRRAMEGMDRGLRDDPTITPGAFHTITALSMIPGVGELLGGLLGGASAAGVPGANAAIGSRALYPALAAGGAVAASKIAGRKKKGAATDPAAGAGGQAAAQQPNLQSAAIMPLFMQQIMEPYLNSIMQQIHGTAQQYGNTMQGMISGHGPTGVALHPAIAQALQAMIPGQQAAMNLLGQSGAGSVVAGSALDQLNAQIQKGIQTQQAAQGAYEKNLLLNQYGGGIPGLTGTGIPGLTATPGLTNPSGLTNPATNPLAKQIATGGGAITG